MKATYVVQGAVAQFKNTSESDAIARGDVVVFGHRLAVAQDKIAAGAVGNVDLEGAFEMPKASGAVSAGDVLWYDATNGKTTGTKAKLTVVAGVALAPAASADTTVLVRLCDAAVVSMGDLADVDVSTPPTNGQILKWDNTDKAYKPGNDAT